MDNEKETVAGTVEEIIYQSESNGYTVCVVDVGGEPVTLVGTMPFLSEGENISAYGVWQLHPTFGRQFRVEMFEKSLPKDEESLLRYLSSGAIKGIGPVTARRIIEKFGEDTIEILQKNPEWLSDIRGITPQRAREIGDSFAEQYGAMSTMLFLGKYFGTTLCVRIYQKYRTNTEIIIKENPYRLCTDIVGVGFVKADKIASDLGFDKCDRKRVEAGIKYVLDSSAFGDGHCYLPEDIFVSRCAELLDVPESDIAFATANLINTGEMVKNVYDTGNGYALITYYGAEKYIAEKLVSLSKNKLPLAVDGINEQIRLSEEKQKITYDEKQREAISSAVQKGVSVVTGGPGTGKTTVIRAIIDILESLKIPYMLAAPTGRAAKRMSESSSRDAKTIHRMLEMIHSDSGKPVFSHDSDCPLQAKVFIIDEVSMVDVLLMEALLKAVKPDSMMIFIGDADQLPSVGPGNVLGDIYKSGLFYTKTLKHIFRQAEKSLIVVNAHKINSGEEPELSRKDGDFFFMERPDPDSLKSLVSSLCHDRLPNAYGYDALDDIQVITPTKRGECGTKELNKVLQESFNPPTKHKKERHIGDVTFREGDKVMQVKNNYDIIWNKGNEEGEGIFNGDIGRIIAIDTKSECFVIDFGGRICDYDFILADELELAYAVTVHKSQGSEYPAVILPLLSCPQPLMTRNLLYTAVTRAKEILICVGDKAVFKRMAANNKKDERFTSLPYLLR